MDETPKRLQHCLVNDLHDGDCYSHYILYHPEGFTQEEWDRIVDEADEEWMRLHGILYLGEEGDVTDEDLQACDDGLVALIVHLNRERGIQELDFAVSEYSE